MRCAIRNLALTAAVVVTGSPELSHAQAGFEPTASASSPFQTGNRIFQASLERIERGSALWRQALDAVRAAGRRVLVVTPADVVMIDVSTRDRLTLDPGVLAEAIPVVDDESSEVPVVVIVVNLRLVQAIHDARLSVPSHFEADVDRILIHEIYGHAVPYLLAGNLSGQCADPRRGEPASRSCSIRRENAVRAELGLGHRADDGLHGLALARGTR
jgi:hypothetical protein